MTITHFAWTITDQTTETLIVAFDGAPSDSVPTIGGTYMQPDLWTWIAGTPHCATPINATVVATNECGIVGEPHIIRIGHHPATLRGANGEPMVGHNGCPVRGA